MTTRARFLIAAFAVLSVHGSVASGEVDADTPLVGPSGEFLEYVDASSDVAFEASPGIEPLVPDCGEECDACPACVVPDFEEGPIPYAERIEFDKAVLEEEPSFKWKLGDGLASLIETPHLPMAAGFAKMFHAEHDRPKTELDGKAIGVQPINERPRLILELNELFLGPGMLSRGLEPPGGAVWRPALWVFGTYRANVAYRETQPGSRGRFLEVAHRLDLFSQLNLSGTERILVGVRPFDEEKFSAREFNSYDFLNGDGLDGLNNGIQTLFFEGDLGEILPFLDPFDVRMLDVGFSIGRQPLLAQQGLLINEDRIDAVTVTRNTLSGSGVLNLRVTGVFAWDQINRHNSAGPPVTQQDHDAKMYAILTETDVAASTINADVVYVDAEDPTRDMVALGISAIQRIHGFQNTYNTSLHALASFPTEGATQTVGQGELLFGQFSWTPHTTEDVIYLNTFWALDRFTSPARGPLMGGPLGQTGILFASTALGQYGPALSNQASNAAGASLGYQMFFEKTRQQVIVEAGGRKDTNGVNDGAIAGGVRYQKALGRHWIFIFDGFVGKQESFPISQGARVEMLAKF